MTGFNLTLDIDLWIRISVCVEQPQHHCDFILNWLFFNPVKTEFLVIEMLEQL